MMKKISRNKKRKKAASGKTDSKLTLSDNWQRPMVGNFIVLTVFAVICFAIYSNTFKSPFVFDDRAHIPENKHIRITELNVKNIMEAGFESPLAQRPVANISFAINYYFNGLDTTGYHLVNILIHILTAFFLYLLFKHTLSLPIFNIKYLNSKLLSLFAALLWLVHPLQIQSVTYIVQRMNSLAAMFYILSLLLYVKGRLNQLSDSKSLSWFIGCMISGILSFGCKEIAATLPFLILLYEWYFFQNMNLSWLKNRFP